MSFSPEDPPVDSKSPGINAPISAIGATVSIDRSAICPVLLRCFWAMQKHHSVVEYRKVSQDIYPPQEVQIYTWPDATLREITELLKDAIISMREPNSSISYHLIFIDKAGCWQFKPLGQVYGGKAGPDDNRSLASVRFEPGDILDIAIFPPGHEGPPKRGGGNRGGGGDRGGGDRAGGGDRGGGGVGANRGAGGGDRAGRRR